MATLDVSDIPLCVEFADTFQVQQRSDFISQTGRTLANRTWSGGAAISVLGTIYPTGDNNLQRQEDKQFGRKTYTIVTTYPLRSTSAGAQPDFVFYRGNIYVVTEVNEYSQYGAGFVEAIVTSVQATDTPPQ